MLLGAIPALVMAVVLWLVYTLVQWLFPNPQMLRGLAFTFIDIVALTMIIGGYPWGGPRERRLPWWYKKWFQ